MGRVGAEVTGGDGLGKAVGQPPAHALSVASGGRHPGSSRGWQLAAGVLSAAGTSSSALHGDSAARIRCSDDGNAPFPGLPVFEDVWRQALSGPLCSSPKPDGTDPDTSVSSELSESD